MQNIPLFFSEEIESEHLENIKSLPGVSLKSASDSIVEAREEGIYFTLSRSGLSLCISENKKRPLCIKIDFFTGASAHRRKYGGGLGQSVAKAVGISAKFKPNILDATAGLGRDSFVLATLGANVTMMERVPAVYALLYDGLARAQHFALEADDSELIDFVKRMRLIHCDALVDMSLPDARYDVVYLDPMFPERKKSAQVKKDMQIFHSVVGADEDADQLLPWALARARYRVVVKRPRIAGCLNGQEPNFKLEGKSSRFDIYTKLAIPK